MEKGRFIFLRGIVDYKKIDISWRHWSNVCARFLLCKVCEICSLECRPRRRLLWYCNFRFLGLLLGMPKRQREITRQNRTPRGRLKTCLCLCLILFQIVTTPAAPAALPEVDSGNAPKTSEKSPTSAQKSLVVSDQRNNVELTHSKLPTDHNILTTTNRIG